VLERATIGYGSTGSSIPVSCRFCCETVVDHSRSVNQYGATIPVMLVADALHAAPVAWAAASPMRRITSASLP
jgi:hypothetical protein